MTSTAPDTHPRMACLYPAGCTGCAPNPDPTTYTYGDRLGDYTRQQNDQRLAEIEGVGLTYLIVGRGAMDDPPDQYLVVIGGGPAPAASVAASFDAFMPALRWITANLELDLG